MSCRVGVARVFWLLPFAANPKSGRSEPDVLVQRNSARPRETAHLKALRKRLGDEFLRGMVLVTGPGQRAGDRLESLPLSSLWSAAAGVV